MNVEMSKRAAQYLAGTGKGLLLAGLFCVLMLMWWRLGACLFGFGCVALGVAVLLDGGVRVLPAALPVQE